MIFPLGSVVNALGVVAGALIGVWLHRRLPDRVKSGLTIAIGLSILLIGLQMALKVENILTLSLGLLIGALIGHALRLEDRVASFGNRLQRRFRARDDRFSHAFISTTMIVCVGSMAIVGALDEGLRGDRSVLFAKSLIDVFIAVVLAATHGIGVAAAAVPLLVYEAGLTWLAAGLQGVLTQTVITQVSATGGVLLIATALDVLEIKKIEVMNLLPALVVVALLAALPVGG